MSDEGPTWEERGAGQLSAGDVVLWRVGDE